MADFTQKLAIDYEQEVECNGIKVRMPLGSEVTSSIFGLKSFGPGDRIAVGIVPKVDGTKKGGGDADRSA